MWNTYEVISLVILAYACIDAGPVVSPRGDSDFQEALHYMTRYGYLKRDFSMNAANGPPNPADIADAITDLQIFLRIKETGRLDDATMAAIRRPRCGVTDGDAVELLKQEPGSPTRARRYTINWHTWDKKLLTYRIINIPSTNSFLTEEQVQSSIRRSFDQFSNVTRLEFKQLFGDNVYADIYIEFSSGKHGDGFPFDGPHGFIAHAFIPNGNYGDLDGDVHFDDSEYFTFEGDDGYNFYQTALHEIGHSLGLDHSWKEGAVMLPDYPGFMSDYALAEDDVRALQVLYGSGMPPSRDDTLDPDAPCNIAYDAAAMIDGQLYIFKDKRYWRTTKLGKTMSPKVGEPIKRRFHNLPRQIDAVYQRPQDGKVVFFKGSKYWVYDKLKTDSSYPRNVSDLGIPGNIDAAVILNKWNKTYFFQGNQVWRYDEVDQDIDSGYPHHINDVFEGIPLSVDAAFDFTDGNTYFVQRKKYYRYSSKHRNADPGYPRFFGQDFIGC